MRDSLKFLRKQIKLRVQGFDKLQEHMIIRLTEGFVRFTEMVGFCGNLVIKPQTEEIFIFVKKYGANTREEARLAVEKMMAEGLKDNVGSLSGGERSISTVMLLMALWKTIPSPIRCIDEFDVFMDPHHKQMATMGLLTYAENEPKVQLCFLTPTGLSDSLKALKARFGDIFAVKQMVSAERPEVE